MSFFRNAGKYPTALRRVPDYLVAQKEKQFKPVVSVGFFRTAEVSGHTLRGDGRPLLFRVAVLCLPPAAGAAQSAAC